MMPFLRPLSLFALSLLVAAACGCKDDPEDTGEPPGETDVDTDVDADTDADSDADADADTDADTDTLPVELTCLGCHQDEELLQASQEPEDTGDPGPESSGEG